MPEVNAKKTGYGLQRLTGALQSIIGGIPDTIKSIDDIKRNLYWNSRYVCRIDIQARELKPKGTGFLVADDLVLTNFHVVEKASEEHIYCRFDYENETKMGSPVGVSEKLAFRPYSEGERLGQCGEPSISPPEDDELDFALLKLKRPVGRDLTRNPDKTVGRRGWIAIPSSVPEIEPNSRVYILQHPLGEPVAEANGSIIEGHGLDTRIQYKTSTRTGSSGSPCFRIRKDNNGLALVALHNYGDPNWCVGEWKEPEFNQGIPIQLVAQDLYQQGIWPQSITWRLKKWERWPHRWFLWRVTDLYESLIRIFTHPRYSYAVIPVLLIAALAFLVFFTPPKPVIASTKYAWFTASNKSNPLNRAHLTVNLTILPSNTVFYMELFAKLFIGGTRFDMSPTSIVHELTYKCFVDDNCTKKNFDQPFPLFKRENYAEEVQFTPASPNLSWRRLMQAFYHDEKVTFVYSLRYRTQSDVDNQRPESSVSISCELDEDQVRELKSLETFSWDTRLPIAFSPYNLKCITSKS